MTVQKNLFAPAATTILNVDDREVCRDTKSRILAAAGYRVIEVETGMDALRLAREAKPQLVLLDVKLPDIDGLEVCRSLKSDNATASIMVVLISGLAMRREDTVSELQEGADGYLVEPVEPVELLATVRALLRLYRSDERLQLALSATNDVVWEWDAVNDAEIWNQAGVDLFGWTDIVEQSQPTTWWVERMHPDDRQRVVDGLHDVLENSMASHWKDEYRFSKADGEYAQVMDRGFVTRNDQGQAIRMTGTMQDMTDWIRTETALRESRERLQCFNKELETQVGERTQELMQSQDRLRALALEVNLAEQRERKRLAGELHDYLAQLLVLGCLKLGQIRRAGLPLKVDEIVKQTEEVLNQALDYSRTLMAELSPPVLQEHGLLAGLKWLGGQMHRHGLAVEVEVDASPSLPLPEGCAMLLFQSVRELLMNVLKHADTQKVRIRLQQGAHRLYLEVRDYGAGFDLADVADNAPTVMSSKFGLFSIRERMAALGGWLDLQSAPGKGTTATLVLPLKTVDSSELKVLSAELSDQVRNSEPRTQNSKLHQQDPKHIRVLLVDDHAMVRQGLRSVLDSYPDIEVVGEAWNGEEAVAMVERLHPSLIVMDINMPKMNGIEATRLIKQSNPETIVICISVKADAVNEEAITKAGAALLLTKEAAVDQLYAAIKQTLSDKH